MKPAQFFIILSAIYTSRFVSERSAKLIALASLVVAVISIAEGVLR